MERLTSHLRRYENFIGPALHAYDMSNEMVLRSTGSPEQIEAQRAHALELARKAGAELAVIRDLDPDSAERLAADWRAYGEELQVDPGLIAIACGAVE